MDRRSFLAGALGAGVFSSPLRAFAQPALVGADMHSHWGMSAWRGNGELNAGNGLRAEMLEAGVLLVAMKVIADFPQLSFRPGKLHGAERVTPGAPRAYFERMAGAIVARARNDGLVVVGTRDDLKAVIEARRPGIALAAEGADFLEGRLDYLETARAAGLCHLQLVHFRLMEVGDVATEPPRFGGLSAFGKDVVRACNRLGILVDVAHCNAQGMEQALAISSKPLIYSHGWMSVQEPPDYAKRNARAIHYPLAKQIAAAGGVVGAFPLSRRDPENFAAYLVSLVKLLGPRHVGIGSDHSGLPNSALSGYRDFPRVAAALAKGGLKPDEVDAVVGGNYLRALQQAVAA